MLYIGVFYGDVLHGGITEWLRRPFSCLRDIYQGLAANLTTGARGSVHFLILVVVKST